MGMAYIENFLLRLDDIEAVLLFLENHGVSVSRTVLEHIREAFEDEEEEKRKEREEDEQELLYSQAAHYTIEDYENVLTSYFKHKRAKRWKENCSPHYGHDVSKTEPPHGPTLEKGQLEHKTNAEKKHENKMLANETTELSLDDLETEAMELLWKLRELADEPAEYEALQPKQPTSDPLPQIKRPTPQPAKLVDQGPEPTKTKQQAEMIDSPNQNTPSTDDFEQETNTETLEI